MKIKFRKKSYGKALNEDHKKQQNLNVNNESLGI